MLPALAADPAALYRKNCSACHDISGIRAPSVPAMRQMSSANLLKALETGIMKSQAAGLSHAERVSLAEYLGAKVAAAAPSVGQCAGAAPAFSLDGPQWNGWGGGLANLRLQSAPGLKASDVPRLRLKWAFGFPGVYVAYSQPAVVGGRVFAGSASGKVYSLDARSGCQLWSYDAGAAVRTGIVVVQLPGSPVRFAAMCGDQRANAHAVDAVTGELLWKTKVDQHPYTRVTGTPAYFEGRLYVPLSSGEEGPAMNPKYECCTSRGAVIALDAATGRQIWKTFTVPESHKLATATAAGTAMWGPSGATVWSSPTIDPAKRVLYVGTGDNHSQPVTDTSDAVLAMDLDTGKIVWSKQITKLDAFNMACVTPNRSNCPDPSGPDHDIGASPMLVSLSTGRRLLLIGQKSGVMHALDPDREGEVVWRTRVGKGGALGGIQWGPATDGKLAFVALSDVTFQAAMVEPGKRLQLNPEVGGGLFALDVATGKQVWYSAPAPCGDRPNCSPAQSAAVSAIPGIVFSGSVDGHLRAYSAADGKVVWDMDTARDYETVNGVPAKGGSMDAAGPVIAGGMLFTTSGYGVWGGMAGNVLLVYGVE